MKKQNYLSDVIRLLTVDQIKLSVSNPSPYMTKTHIALHYIALRKLGASK
jgi:hypothetical protein